MVRFASLLLTELNFPFEWNDHPLHCQNRMSAQAKVMNGPLLAGQVAGATTVNSVLQGFDLYRLQGGEDSRLGYVTREKLQKDFVNQNHNFEALK